MVSKLIERIGSDIPKVQSSPYDVINKNYSIFSEQYLERFVIFGDYNTALTPTACSIAGIPVIDDF